MAPIRNGALLLDPNVGAIFEIDGQTLILAEQDANTVLAGPTVGLPVEPTFRALVTADIPLHGDDRHTDQTRSIHLSVDEIGPGKAAPTRTNLAGGYYTYGYDLVEAATPNRSGIVFSFMVPSDWLSGTIAIKVHWTTLINGAGETVVFNGSYMRSSAGADMIGAKTGVSGVVPAVPATAGQRQVSTMGAALTVAAGEVVDVEIERIPYHASDTWAHSLYLVGIELVYTAAR